MKLAHLCCGHLGTPNDRWWAGLSEQLREFEAESVCYLLLRRARYRQSFGPRVSTGLTVMIIPLASFLSDRCDCRRCRPSARDQRTPLECRSLGKRVPVQTTPNQARKPAHTKPSWIATKTPAWTRNRIRTGADFTTKKTEPVVVT